ncbi:MAG: hypothetical protein K0Q49_947 [Haloplasmataceae bacterium]|jgi:hypothetical protein|nr:hypothetical protein [Haloplasmataceae bacterium]
MFNNELSNLKVIVNYNPYFYEETQISVNTVEQITFEHKKLNGTKVLGEFLKDKNVSKFNRRSILKDILKFWDKDFKAKLNSQKEDLLNRTESVKKKKVKKFDFASIYAFAFICVLGIMIQVNLFNSTKIKQLLYRPLYNNILIGLIYFTLIACLYMILIKSYIEAFRFVGNGSKKFIYQEFKDIKRNFNLQHKELKSHLFKYVNINSYKQPFKLKKIYDPQFVLTRLEKYRFYISDKLSQFSKNYYVILIVAFFFKLIVLGLIIILGISYMNL